MAKLITLGLTSAPPSDWQAGPPQPQTPAGTEIGQVSQPWNVPPGGGDKGVPATAADMREIGATGTPIFSGFLRELGEYNPDLSWPTAYMVYERMRRSDAQVAATLWASKLPIRGGEWMVQPPEDANAIEQEATEFIEQEMFDGEIDFDGVLENALLMFDFGAAMHEDVYYVDQNRVRVKKLAARLPLTWYRWLCKPGTDELETVEQLGYRAGQYIRTDVPMNKSTLFVFRQEGANFTGRALLREMYQHWFIKNNLYKIEAVACERNGLGVPVITMGPDVKVEDRTTAMAWLKSLAANERTGLLLPPEWKFALEGVTGNVRDPKDAIQHHGTMITVVGLAQFMMMGSSGHSSGNRSLGETMSDFFFMGLQATADLIGRRISQTTVKRLVDYNFDGIKPGRYPQLIPQSVMALKFDAIAQALGQLGQGNVVTPTPELEAWIRKLMGAPEADSATIIRERAKRQVSLPGQAPGQGGQQDQQGAGDGTKGPNSGQQAGQADAKDARPAGPWDGGDAAGKRGKGPDKGKDVAASSLAVNRPPRGPEKWLAAADIVSALDKGRDDVAAALRKARGRVQAEIVNKLVNTPVRNLHRVSTAADEKLIAEVEELLRGISDFGTRQVGEERARQLAGRKPADAAQVRDAVVAAEKRDQVGLCADALVSKFQNNLTARAANVAANRMRNTGDATKGEVIQGIGADLDDQSDKWIDGVAGEGANEAFADGRNAGYEQYKDEIGSCYYSALLDLHTCETCAGADGQTAETPDDLPDTPNPDCDGGDKCRCVIVYVFSDEGEKVA
jgi:phage gp29-like protein